MVCGVCGGAWLLQCLQCGVRVFLQVRKLQRARRGYDGGYLGIGSTRLRPLRFTVLGRSSLQHLYMCVGVRHGVFVSLCGGRLRLRKSDTWDLYRRRQTRSIPGYPSDSSDPKTGSPQRPIRSKSARIPLLACVSARSIIPPRLKNLRMAEDRAAGMEVERLRSPLRSSGSFFL